MAKIVNFQDKLEKALDTLKQVRETTSSNGKMELLGQQVDNEVLKTILYLTYNPFIQYYIKKIPDVKPSGVTPCEEVYKEFLELLVQLKTRQFTGNAAIDALSLFLVKCSPEEYDWYTKVIQRDIKCGIAEKNINKVFKDLIPTYEVLLANSVKDDITLSDKKTLRMLPENMVCQYKIDGYRMNIYHTSDEFVYICSRNGKVISGYTDLENEVREKLPKGYVYDGEMVSVELENWITQNMNSSGVTEANRELFTEAVSHAFSKELNKQGVFNLFDMIPIEQWEKRNTTEPYSERIGRIQKLLGDSSFDTIKTVPVSRVYHKSNPDDLKAIVKLFQEFLSWGWEGLMIKDWDACYEFKRSNSLLKMKLMETIDLEVIDVFEGEKGSKYEGMMGGVYVLYKGNPVGVGSGWSDDQRAEFWKNPEKIVGKTIEVSYQAESKDKTGKPSLSFPVFKVIRWDK